MGIDHLGMVVEPSRLSWSGFVYKRGGGILDKTHPPNFGPTHPTFDPPRPLPPLIILWGAFFVNQIGYISLPLQISFMMSHGKKGGKQLHCFCAMTRICQPEELGPGSCSCACNVPPTRILHIFDKHTVKDEIIILR